LRSAVTSTATQAFLLPGYSAPGDGSRSDRFADGGWVELAPRDAQLPQWRSPRVDEKASTPGRRLEDFADDAFWDDVLEGLDELLDESPDEAPSASAHQPSRTIRADGDRVESTEPPIAYRAAAYDEGGMIALGVAEGDRLQAAPVVVQMAPLEDAAPAAIEAGVALFHAFEWGDASGDAPSEPATSAQEAELLDEPAELPADEPPGTVQQVVVGVGLAAITGGHALRRRRAAERQDRQQAAS
jgi:hypothetical protein